MFVRTHTTLGSAHRINAIHSGTDTIWTLWHDAMKTKSMKRMGQSRPAPGSSVTSSKFVRGERENRDLPCRQRSKYLERGSCSLTCLRHDLLLVRWQLVQGDVAPGHLKPRGRGKTGLSWASGKIKRGKVWLCPKDCRSFHTTATAWSGEMLCPQWGAQFFP